jgi:hypothetical protein
VVQQSLTFRIALWIVKSGKYLRISSIAQFFNKYEFNSEKLAQFGIVKYNNYLYNLFNYAMTTTPPTFEQDKLKFLVHLTHG